MRLDRFVVVVFGAGVGEEGSKFGCKRDEAWKGVNGLGKEGLNQENLFAG